MVVMDPEGNESELTVYSNKVGQDHMITASTSVTLPSTERSDYVYRFLDEERKTVLLLIENMYTYRESFEMDIALKGSRRKDLANHLYRKYNAKSPPVGHKS